uniref:leucine-rich repeat and immunoglobulin-like domain-containing nogo receptor-interacting protein 2 isoform X1 n=2 Tax=Myxine glutinosa TaxID=7769 RepID=UPI0035902CA4
MQIWPMSGIQNVPAWRRDEGLEFESQAAWRSSDHDSHLFYEQQVLHLEGMHGDGTGDMETQSTEHPKNVLSSPHWIFPSSMIFSPSLLTIFPSPFKPCLPLSLHLCILSHGPHSPRQCSFPHHPCSSLPLVNIPHSRSLPTITPPPISNAISTSCFRPMQCRSSHPISLCTCRFYSQPPSTYPSNVHSPFYPQASPHFPSCLHVPYFSTSLPQSNPHSYSCLSNRLSISSHKSLPPFIPLLALLVLAILMRPCLACPTSCSCSPYNDSVSCRAVLLTSAPISLPDETRILDLSGNRLLAATPNELFSLPPGIEHLDLSSNEISIIDRAAFAGLPRLQRLNLTKNYLTLVVAGAFDGLHHLSSLDLSYNGLVVLLDGGFRHLSSLKCLNISFNELVFVAPQALQGLTGLLQLTLDGGNLSAIPTSALAPLTSLQELQLRWFPLTVLPANAFAGLHTLHNITLEGWPHLSSMNPDSLLGLKLCSFSVTWTNLSVVPHLALVSQPWLRHLDISHNPLTRLLPFAFPPLHCLQELNLEDTGLESVAYGALAGVPALRIIDLSNNELQDLEKSSFGQPPFSLQLLRLSGNPLMCDCRLSWLLTAQLDFGKPEPVCSSPSESRGLKLSALLSSTLSGLKRCDTRDIGWQKQQRSRTEVWPACQSQSNTSWLKEPVAWQGENTNNGIREMSKIEVTDQRIANETHKSAGLRRTHSSCFVGVADTKDELITHVFTENVTANNTMGRAAFEPIAVMTIVIATAMGCFTFLGVVLFCLAFLFVWTRGRGRRKQATSITYMPRLQENRPQPPHRRLPTRHFNMKLI